MSTPPVKKPPTGPSAGCATNPTLRMGTTAGTRPLQPLRAALLGDVARAAAHLVGARYTCVVDGHAHAEGGVEQDVAVQHPDAGIVSGERNVPRLVRAHQDRVQVNRAALDR